MAQVSRFTPVRVAVQGWELEVAPAKHDAWTAHELTHVEQQDSAASADGKYVIRKIMGRTKPAGSSPEVGDEVLIAFETGVARHATLYFNPTEITVTKPTPWKVELGPVAGAAYRVRVIKAGPERLGMLIRTSLDAAGTRGTSWSKVL